MLRYVSLCIFTFFSIFGLYAEPDKSPVLVLQGSVDKALDALYAPENINKSTEAKRDLVRLAFEANYDLDIIIRRAIGRNWRRLSEDEQMEVLELIKQVVLKAYIDGMNGKAMPILAYGDVVEIASNRIEVPSTVEFDGRVVHLKYRLAQMQSGWQIYDLVAEEISLVSNYRQQFDAHFRRGSGSELIEKLKELLQREKLEPNTSL